jgi:hypothetical protein
MHQEYDNIDESKLRSLEVSGGFSVPHGYFTQMRGFVLEQTTGAEINRGQVPEGYFERSKLAILQKTVGTAKSKLTVWYNRPVFRYSAAAGVLLVAGSIFLFNVSSTQNIQTASISDEEILMYLEQSDVQDVSMSEVSFAATTGDQKNTAEETYIVNQTDEQVLLEEL